MAFFIFMAIAAIPAVAALVLRVNAVLLFASIAAGELLVLRFADDAELVVGLALQGPEAKVIASMIVLFFPLVLTFIFANKSIHGTRFILHVIPILATSLLFASLTFPYLPATFEKEILASPLGNQLIKSTDLIIGVAVMSDLLLLWWSHRPGKHKAKHK